MCDVESITHAKSFTDSSLIRISYLHWDVHISRLHNFRAGCTCNVGCERRHEKASLRMMCEGDYSPHLSGVVIDKVRRKWLLADKNKR